MPSSRHPSTRATTAALAALLVGAGWLAWQDMDAPRQPPGKVAAFDDSASPTAAARLHGAMSLEQAFFSGRPLRLPLDGRDQGFRLSLSELHLPGLPVERRLAQFPAVRDADQLLAEAERRSSGAAAAELVFYPTGHEGQARLRHVLKNRFVVEVSDAALAQASLAALRLRVASRPDYAPGLWIVEPEAGGALATLRALEQAGTRPGIRGVSALMGRRRQKEWLPNDPLFSQQWHLRNTTPGGVDINVTSVWDSYKGDTARIAIVDDGLDLQHPDLLPNLDTQNGYDWNDSPHDADPSPRPHAQQSYEDNHGTAVAGVAAARGGNGAGVSGVAPLATLVGLRLISEQDQDPDGVSDEEEAEAMAFKNHLIDIKNNSWSAGFPSNILAGPGPLTRAAMQNATQAGRGGRGTLLVIAAGNGRQANEQGQKDGYTNSMHAIAVGSVTNAGAMSSYSEGGPHLVVMAPSNGGTRSIWTADLRGNNGYNRAGPAGGQPGDRNYTSTFGGTSSATPVISGVAALMLNANPQLNWRDVKEIFLRSSIRVNPGDTAWTSRHGGDPSLPMIQHHEDYGGGRVDAAAAVAMAQSWESLGPVVQHTRSDSTARAIPDYSSTGANEGISIPFDFSALAALRVEHATLSLRLTHTFRGDLGIRLISPAGTISNLAVRTVGDNGRQGYDNWIFTSVRHWGEASGGVWTLNIRDLAARDRGDFLAASLTLHGTDAAAPAVTSHTPGPFFLRAGSSLALEGEGTGGGRLAFIWSRDGVRLPGNRRRLEIPAIQAGEGGAYQLNVMNAGGSAPSGPIAVGVVGGLPASALVVEGRSHQIQAPASGPGLQYQWLRGGQELSDDGNLTGATSPTLRITTAAAAHAGSYTCRITMTGHPETLETSAMRLDVLLRPVMNPPAFGNAVRGSTVGAAFSATNSPTSYRLTGRLPAGVRFNSTTGQFSGRPVAVGTHTLRVSATNAAGTSDEIELVWTVEDFPQEAVGSWRALAARNEDMNLGMAGTLSLTVSPTGAYSARLVQGVKAYVFSGQLDALPAKATFTTPFSINRGRLLPALVGSFTLDLANGLLTGSCAFTGIPASATSLSGHRCPWKATNKAVPASTVFHTAAQIPPGGLEALDDSFPHGAGWLVLTLSPTGTLFWSGRLADDTPLSGSTLLGPEGQFGIHQMLYASQGSIRAEATVGLGSGLVDGALGWMKLAPLRNPPRSYGGGIPLHTLQLRGAAYSRPAREEMLLGLAEPGPPPLDQNARLHFRDAASLDQPLEQDIQITKAGAARVAVATALNPRSVRLSLAASNGLFSGTFLFRDDHPIDSLKPKVVRNGLFRGLIIRRPGLDQGIGYFTLPRLPETATEPPASTPIFSGMAELLAP